MENYRSDKPNKESIIIKSSQHWAVFIMPAIPLFFFVVLFLFAISSSSPTFYLMLALAFLLAGAAQLVRTYLIYFTTKFFLTNSRVVARSGFLRRRQLELLLSQIESIDVDQPLLGRFLDYGTVRIVGTGGTSQAIKSLRYPAEIRRSIYELTGKIVDF